MRKYSEFACYGAILRPLRLHSHPHRSWTPSSTHNLVPHPPGSLVIPTVYSSLPSFTHSSQDPFYCVRMLGNDSPFRQDYFPCPPEEVARCASIKQGLRTCESEGTRNPSFIYTQQSNLSGHDDGGVML